MWEIDVYETADGRNPTKEHLKEVATLLGKKHLAKALQDIDLLAEHGTALKWPKTDSLQDGIHELRTQFAGNISRVLFFYVHQKRIVLLNGFIKKTQKTPSAEMVKARKYRDDWLARKEGHP